ncbi:Glucuronosyltransferase [Aphelenchoides bicaudatus]|nr:Glucuronosyltransferase [Aphelenchoides bicaudatus]
MLKLIFVLFSLFYSTYAFRALFLASNVGHSHIEYTGRLADLLVDAGHEVDFVVEVWNNFYKQNGSKKANVIRFTGKNLDAMEEIASKISVYADAFQNDMTIAEYALFGQITGLHCEAILSDHELLSYLKTRNYTVGLAEGYDGCAFAVFRLLGIKSIHETNAIAMPETTAFAHGIPYDFRHIAVMHNDAQVGPIRKFTDMLRNFYEYLVVRYHLEYAQYGPTENAIQKALGANHPTISEMRRRTSYVWVNTYEVMDYTRLNSPKVKHIGGIAVNRNSGKLNKETEQIFEQANKGVVLVSFGSLVNTLYMKESMRKQFLEMFASFPDYQFIWRFTEVNDEILTDVKNYTNVHVFKWVQQTAILSHPRTAAFVSHIGLNSLNEAVYYGTPLVAVPFFGDQPINAGTVLNAENGVHVSRKDIGELKGALNEVLNNKKYRERAQDLKEKVRNMPISPEETFVKFVEYAERFDVTKDLMLDAANETIIQEFNLDIIGLGLLFALVVGYLTYKASHYFYICAVLALNVVLRILNSVAVTSRSKKVD